MLQRPLQRKLPILLHTRTTPKMPLHLRGFGPPSDTWFRGPTRVFTQNGMSIGSAVFFAPRTVDCPITLEWAATFPQNFPFRGGSGLLFNTWYLGPPDALTQAASRLIQLFLYGSQMLWCTMHCQWDRKLQHFPFLWDFITLLLSEEERSTAISNEHKKLVNIARVVWKICSRTNRQTDTHTDRHTQTDTHRRAHYNTLPPLPRTK